MGAMDFFETPAYADVEFKKNTPVDLDAIRYLESSNKPFWQFLLPGKDKEIGVYQITPNMFKDLKQWMPDKYKNKNFWAIAAVPSWAKKAAQDYINLLGQFYPKRMGVTNPDILDIVEGYNAGPRALKKEINPEYKRAYLDYTGQRR